jgi:hypothetical protein
MSDYEDNRDMDSTNSSTKEFFWMFGNKRDEPTFKVQGDRRNARRTTEQILATARAVANDINHPNQEEVVCV